MKPKLSYYLSVFFIFCFVMISCDQNSESTLKQVEIEEDSNTVLEPTRTMNTGENLLYNPLRIINYNDEYLVLTETRGENFFHVYSLPDLSFKYSWGKAGRGPNEFQTPPVYMDVSEESFIVYEGITRELRHFQIADTSFVYMDKSLLSYEGQTQPLNRIKRINDTLYFANYSTFEDTDFEHVALSPGVDTLLFLFGNYPSSDLESIEKEFHFSKSNTSNPDGSKFAAFYTKQNKLKIYDNHGDLLNEIDIDDHNLLPENLNNDDFMYRSAVWASDNYIYTIGYNGTSERIFEDFDETFRTSIEVWNWEGEFINRVKFDRLIHNLTISEEFRKVYAFSYLHEDKIFEYDLDDVLEVE